MQLRTFKKQKPLDDSLDDFIITVSDWDEESNKMVSFCVVQICYFGENTYEIVKFDSAHGHCHIHRYYRRLNDEGEPIEKDNSPAAFDEFRNDVKENWRKYKRLYVEKWLSDK